MGVNKQRRKVIKSVAAGAAASTLPLPFISRSGFASAPIVLGLPLAQSTAGGVADHLDHLQGAILAQEEINAAGGLLGKQIKWIEADTKSDQAQSASAGLQLVDEGAEMLIVTCDYDFGAPAALAAEAAGLNSFFLCAEDIKAGIQGVGPNSFSASVLAAVQGATMAEWSVKERSAKTGYVLLDTTIEYNKGICTGFDWMLSLIHI